MRMLESNHSREFQTNRCRAALTPDYTPSPAKWLRPKRSEIRATLNTAASFSPAAVSRLRTPSDQGLGHGMADAISRTGYQGRLAPGVEWVFGRLMLIGAPIAIIAMY